MKFANYYSVKERFTHFIQNIGGCNGCKPEGDVWIVVTGYTLKFLVLALRQLAGRKVF